MRQFVFSLLLTSVFSQNTSALGLDSLYNLIKQKEIPDSTRVLALTELAYKLHGIDSDSSLYYASLANTISEKINYTKGKGRANRVIGIYYLIKSDYSKSIKFLEAALLYSQNTNDKNHVAACYGNLGLVYNELGNNERAIEYQLLAMKIRHETGDRRGIAIGHNNIGAIYAEQGDMDRALNHYFKALELFLIIKDQVQIASIYQNIGVIYAKNKKFLDALDYLHKALNILETFDYKLALASNYAILAELYIDLNEKENAFKFLKKANEVVEKLNSRDGIARIKKLYAKYYFMTNKPELSYQYAAESQMIAKEIGNMNTWSEASNEKYKAALKLTKYKEALENYKLYITLRDSLKNEPFHQKAIYLDHALKEQKMKMDQEREELQFAAESERIKRIKNTVGGLIFIFVSICLYSLYRAWENKTRKELTKIREKISRDIHDEMGSNLSTINILSNVAMGILSSPDKNVKAKEMLGKISDMSHHVMESVDEIVWSLNHQHGSFEEIVGRMRLLGGQLLESQNINFKFCVEGDPARCNLTLDRRNDFYLIYKESITNIAKYAKCKNVHANLTIRRETITLVITDDGVGFNTNILSGGNGLHNMKARSRNLKGQIKIWSEINKGSKMELAFSA